MKLLALLTVGGLLSLVLPAAGQQAQRNPVERTTVNNNAATERQLMRYYNKKQYNQLDQYNKDRNARLYYYYKAVFANVCNQPAMSNRYLDSFLRRKKAADDKAYWNLRHDNYAKSYDYTRALHANRQLLSLLTKAKNKEQAMDIERTGKIWELATGIPPQQVLYPMPVTLPVQRDRAGLMNIHIQAAGRQVNFVFDTGAGLSVISESWADSLGLRRSDSGKVIVKGFTGHTVQAGIGTVDSLLIGTVVVRYPLFFIFPDSTLSFGGGVYKINGIVGLPIAKDLGTITLAKDSIRFGDAGIVQERNLFISFLHPIVMLKYKGQEGPYVFDTGADRSLFSKAFFNKYGSDPLIRQSPTTQTAYSGAGGTATPSVKKIAALQLQSGAQEVLFAPAEINLSNYHISGREILGNIGQDLLRKYSRVIISFDHNFLYLEKD